MEGGREGGREERREGGREGGQRNHVNACIHKTSRNVEFLSSLKLITSYHIVSLVLKLEEGRNQSGI